MSQFTEADAKEVDLINLLAIELLERFGVDRPSQQQIDTMESFIVQVVCDGQFILHDKLTAREKDCLYWAAQGKSTEATAEILEIHKTTVETHRRNIKQKLNCQSIAHAVYTGMRYGSLCPQLNCNCSSVNM